MKWYKRLGLIVLSVMLAMSTIPAYAIENNGTGGGSSSGPSTRGWIGRYWAFQENNGIRVYLADKNGYVVSNMIDFVNYIPETFTAFNSDLAQWYKEYEGYTGKRPVKKEIAYLGGAKTDRNYGISYTKHPDTGVINSNPGVYFFPKKSESDSDRGEYYPQKMYTYTFLENALHDYISNQFPGNTAHIAPIDGDYTYTDPSTQQPVTVPHRIQGPVQRGGIGNVGTGDILMKQMMTPLGEKDGQPVFTLQELLYLELPEVSPNGMRVTGGPEPLFEFYNTDLKKQHADLMATGLNYGEAMLKVANDNGLYMGAECCGQAFL